MEFSFFFILFTALKRERENMLNYMWYNGCFVSDKGYLCTTELSSSGIYSDVIYSFGGVNSRARKLGTLIRLSALYQSIDKSGSRRLCSRISRETLRTRTLHRFARKRNIWLKLRGITSVSSFHGEINGMA